MEDKVKAWIEMDYNNTKNYISSHPNDSECVERIEQSVDRCYGVIMFAINNLFNEYNYNLGNWWEDEILPKFRKMREDIIFHS